MTLHIITDNDEQITLTEDNISFFHLYENIVIRHSRNYQNITGVELKIKIDNKITFNDTEIESPEEITERLMKWKDVKKIILENENKSYTYVMPWLNSPDKRENLYQFNSLPHKDYLIIIINKNNVNPNVDGRRKS